MVELKPVFKAKDDVSKFYFINNIFIPFPFSKMQVYIEHSWTLHPRSPQWFSIIPEHGLQSKVECFRLQSACQTQTHISMHTAHTHTHTGVLAHIYMQTCISIPHKSTQPSTHRQTHTGTQRNSNGYGILFSCVPKYNDIFFAYSSMTILQYIRHSHTKYKSIR